MYNIFYCPKCRFEDKKYKPSMDNLTLLNLRDGYGKIIKHYKCPNCENLLAGHIVAIRNEVELEYYKTIIADYNEGGSYYDEDIQMKAMHNYCRK